MNKENQFIEEFRNFKNFSKKLDILLLIPTHDDLV